MEYEIHVTGDTKPSDHNAVVAALEALITALHAIPGAKIVDLSGTVIDGIHVTADEADPRQAGFG